MAGKGFYYRGQAGRPQNTKLETMFQLFEILGNPQNFEVPFRFLLGHFWLKVSNRGNFRIAKKGQGIEATDRISKKTQDPRKTKKFVTSSPNSG